MAIKIKEYVGYFENKNKKNEEKNSPKPNNQKGSKPNSPKVQRHQGRGR